MRRRSGSLANDRTRTAHSLVTPAQRGCATDSPSNRTCCSYPAANQGTTAYDAYGGVLGVIGAQGIVGYQGDITDPTTNTWTRAPGGTNPPRRRFVRGVRSLVAVAVGGVLLASCERGQLSPQIAIAREDGTLVAYVISCPDAQELSVSLIRSDDEIAGTKMTSFSGRRLRIRPFPTTSPCAWRGDRHQASASSVHWLAR